MKCIDNELIQGFVDGETNPQETAQIKKHLTDCPQCARNIEEQQAFAETIKKRIDNLSRQPVVVPKFVAPTIRKSKPNRKIWYYASAAAAACAAFLIMFLRPEQEIVPCHTSTIHFIYSFNGDFDSNKTVSQQEMTIIMIDADGKIIECN